MEVISYNAATAKYGVRALLPVNGDPVSAQAGVPNTQLKTYFAPLRWLHNTRGPEPESEEDKEADGVMAPDPVQRLLDELGVVEPAHIVYTGSSDYRREGERESDEPGPELEPEPPSEPEPPPEPMADCPGPGIPSTPV